MRTYHFIYILCLMLLTIDGIQATILPMMLVNFLMMDSKALHNFNPLK